MPESLRGSRDFHSVRQGRWQRLTKYSYNGIIVIITLKNRFGCLQ